MKYKNKSEIFTKLLIGIAFVALFVTFAYANSILFFRQAHCYEHMEGERVKYFSDMPFYIDELGLENKHAYPLLFNLARVLMTFLEPNDAMGMATLVLNMLCIPILTVLFWRSLSGTKNIVYRVGALGLPYVILLVSMLWMPSGNSAYGIHSRYLGVFTPNPWHNQTFLAARPFAIVAFIFFVKIICYYEEKINILDYIVFSIALLLATIAKPSFTLVLGSVAVPFMIIRFIYKRFSTFRNSLMLGLCFLPTALMLISQFFGVYGENSSESAGGIAVGYLSIWSIYSKNIPLSLILALAFPVIVLVFNFRALFRERAYRFAWEFLIAGTVEFIFLKEEGERYTDANFAWGYMYGLFFIYLMSVWLLGKNTVGKKNSMVILCIEWMGLLLHLVAGIIYFVYLLKGGNYMVF